MENNNMTIENFLMHFTIGVLGGIWPVAIYNNFIKNRLENPKIRVEITNFYPDGMPSSNPRLIIKNQGKCSIEIIHCNYINGSAGAGKLDPNNHIQYGI